MPEASHDAPPADRWSIPDGFDLDAFLGKPLVARLATTGRHGPTVRPLRYLWEEQCFWWLTGAWSKLGQLHVTHILAKLRLRDRVQAVVFAYECGLVQPGAQERPAT